MKFSLGLSENIFPQKWPESYENTWKNTPTSYINISRDCHVKRPSLSQITSQLRFTKDLMRWLNGRHRKKITSTDTQGTANHIWWRLNPFCTLYFLKAASRRGCRYTAWLNAYTPFAWDERRTKHNPKKEFSGDVVEKHSIRVAGREWHLANDRQAVTQHHRRRGYRDSNVRFVKKIKKCWQMHARP